MPIGRNITFFMRERKLTLPQLAIKAGMDKGNLYRIVQTGKGYSARSLASIADALGVKEADLFNEFPGAELLPAGLRRVPILDDVQAGAFAGVAPYFRDDEMQEYTLTSKEYSDKAFAMRVKGDSMIPDFQPGDTVIVDPDHAPKAGQFVVAVDSGGLGTIKRYAERGMDTHGRSIFELMPSNPVYASWRSDQSELRIIGVCRQRVVNLP